jgi:hypothetical protein
MSPSPEKGTEKRTWTYGEFKRTCSINDKELYNIRDLLRDHLMEHGITKEKFNTSEAKATVKEAIRSFSVPDCLLRLPEDVIEYNLTKLAGYITYNRRRGYGKQQLPGSTIEQEPSLPGSTIKQEPSLPGSTITISKPRFLAAPQQRDAGLGLLQLTVQGVDEEDMSICNTEDLLRDEKSVDNATVNDLNYATWIKSLEDDILFNKETQRITFTSPAGKKIPVLNERNWRAVIRMALNAGNRDIIFCIQQNTRQGISFSLSLSLLPSLY